MSMLLFTSSPLAHPALLDDRADGVYRVVFGCAVVTVSAWRL